MIFHFNKIGLLDTGHTLKTRIAIVTSAVKGLYFMYSASNYFMRMNAPLCKSFHVVYGA